MAVIIGYPLRGGFEENSVRDVVEHVRDECGAEKIVVVAPKLPSGLEFRDVRVDDYYRLSLPIERGEEYVPGVSDLPFHELVKVSDKAGKRYVNMGLGINEGVRRFKLKWGAEKFLPYQYGVLRRPEKPSFLEIFRRL